MEPSRRCLKSDKLKGGRKQRAAAREILLAHSASQLKFQSRLAKHLIEQWAWGQYSATEVQTLAKAAYDDQVAFAASNNIGKQTIPEDLFKLASLGCSGRYPGNMHRDLLTWLGDLNVVKPFQCNIQVKVQKPRKTTLAISTVPMHFLLPHEVFHHIYDQHRALFNTLFLGDSEGSNSTVSSFWRELVARRDPRLQHHPMVNREQWDTKAIPISIHGDGVACIRVNRAGSRTLDVFSWQGMLGRGGTLFLKHYMCAVFVASCTSHTMSAVWRVLMWSLWWLFQGVFPDSDHTGKRFAATSADGQAAGHPLAGGYFGVLLTIKGDMKFFHECLGMAAATAEEPCDHCPCHKKIDGDADYQVFNFAINAKWKSKLFTASAWRARCPNRHVLFMDPWSFLSQHNCEPDILHIVYLGVFQTIIGSLIWLLVYRCIAGSPTANMAQLWEHILEYYSTFKVSCQFSSIVMSTWHDPAKPNTAYPRLKGKGMEAKCLLPAVLSAMDKFKRRGVPDDEMAITMVSKLRDIDRIWDDSSFSYFVPWDQSMIVMQLADEFLEMHSILHNRAAGRGELLWHTIPKTHAFWHVAFKSRFQHPRLGSTSIDEDFVGRIKCIVPVSARGVKLHAVPGKVAEKFRYGKHFMYSFADPSS